MVILSVGITMGYSKMATVLKRERLRFTDELVNYLQEVDYRIARTEAEKHEIYQFRYQSYLRNKSIPENDLEFLSDDYDRLFELLAIWLAL